MTKEIRSQFIKTCKESGVNTLDWLKTSYLLEQIGDIEKYPDLNEEEFVQLFNELNIM